MRSRPCPVLMVESRWWYRDVHCKLHPILCLKFFTVNCWSKLYLGCGWKWRDPILPRLCIPLKTKKILDITQQTNIGRLGTWEEKGKLISSGPGEQHGKFPGFLTTSRSSQLRCCRSFQETQSLQQTQTKKDLRKA